MNIVNPALNGHAPAPDKNGPPVQEKGVHNPGLVISDVPPSTDTAF